LIACHKVQNALLAHGHFTISSWSLKPTPSALSSKAPLMRLSLLAVIAVVAVALAPVHAEDMHKNPYTLAGGTVVDPHNGEAPRSADDNTYMTLSGLGPMAGHGRFRG
jgi:hypothetical protein